MRYHACRYASEYNDAQTSSSTSVGKLDDDRLWNDSRLDTATKELPDRFPPAHTVIERPVIDVHPDEGVGIAALESSGVAHGMVERIRSVLESVSDACPQVTGNLLLDVFTQILSDDISPQWQRKSGFAEPPFAHVGDEVEALTAVSELPFMYQQSGIDFAPEHCVIDLVEGREHRLEVRLIQSQCEIGAGERTGNSDSLPRTSLRLMGERATSLGP